MTAALIIAPAYALMAQETNSDIRRSVISKEYIRTDDSASTGMVIKAGRSSKSADKLPVTVFVVHHDEIVENGSVTLCDVLKRVPGFRVSQPHTAEFGEAFVQRGLTGNIYTKILLNGAEISPSGPEGMPLGANIPIRQAERIEIIYGPASASYGNDACSGVINIVTKNKFEKEYATADVILGDGGYSYANFQAGGKLGYGNKVVDYTIYGSTQNYDDMPIYKGEDVYNPWYYLAQKNDGGQVISHPVLGDVMPADMNEQIVAAITSANPVLGAFWSRHQGSITCADICDIKQSAAQIGIEARYKTLSLTYNYMRRKDFSNIGVSTLFWPCIDENGHVGEDIHRVVLGNDVVHGKLSSSTKALLNHYRMMKDSYSTVSWNSSNQYVWAASDDIAITQDFGYKCMDNLELYGGMSFSYSGILPYTNASHNRFDYDSYHWFAKDVDYVDGTFGKFGINPYVISKAGLSAQADWDLLDDRLFLTAGIRYDHSSKFGASFNPRIAGLLKLNNHINIRLSHGYAYKEPSAENLYYCLSLYSPITGTNNFEHIENPNINPERMSSTEGGIRYVFNPEKKNFSYVEFVGYTMNIKEQLVRSWVTLDTSKYHGLGSSENRTMTRMYTNEKDGEVVLRAFQLIAVARDLVKSVHFNITGSLTYSSGHEYISPTGPSEQAEYTKIDYVRMVPKWYGQFSYDITFLKKFNLGVDNIVSSKFARKYYEGHDNKYFWYPKFCDMDIRLNIHLSKHLFLQLKCQNALNQKYGGIDNKRLDVDLPYNPQLMRRFRMGITYEF